MGTTLHELGLPPGRFASSWNLEQPARVLDTHRAFMAAGAQELCTNTLGSLPGRPRWQDELLAGLQLAHRAGAPRLWLALGPGEGHAEALLLVRDARFDGVLLETFVDAEAGLSAADAVRSLYDGPLVLSLVPDDTGTIRGLEPPQLLREAHALRLTGIGLNCAPASAVRAGLCRLRGSLPLWAKPSDPTPADLVTLAPQAHWIGGCCGTSPSILGRAARLLATAHPG